MGQPWTPTDGLVTSLAEALDAVPAVTPGERFEVWAARCRLQQDGAHSLTRQATPSHFTASALVLTPDARHTCLVLHGRMNLWVQPGGHLEPGDATVAGAAAREALEETGLDGRPDPRPVQLVRHRAPCRPEADWHLDLQFVLVCGRDDLTVSDESHDVRWWPVDALPHDVADGVPHGVDLAVRRVRGA